MEGGKALATLSEVACFPHKVEKHHGVSSPLLTGLPCFLNKTISSVCPRALKPHQLSAKVNYKHKGNMPLAQASCLQWEPPQRTVLPVSVRIGSSLLSTTSLQ